MALSVSVARRVVKNSPSSWKTTVERVAIACSCAPISTQAFTTLSLSSVIRPTYAATRHRASILTENSWCNPVRADAAFARRAFSTVAAGAASPASLSESTFHDIADETLETIESAFSTAEEELPGGEGRGGESTTGETADISVAMGVMTFKVKLNLGPEEMKLLRAASQVPTDKQSPVELTWVLNKQTPNRQIWWSSPISGPRRYQWDAVAGRWCNTRDGSDMLESLRDEIHNLLHVKLDLS
jgi:frataxin-like iron-binding protein CyaY